LGWWRCAGCGGVLGGGDCESDRQVAVPHRLCRTDHHFSQRATVVLCYQ
jgi:hypothetical protein